MKKGNAAMMTVIMVGIIIGVIAVSLVYQQVTGQLATTAVTDDQLTASNTTCTRVTDKCILSGSATGENATGGQVLSLTECGGAAVNRDYGLIVNNDSYNGKTVNSSYTEVECNYLAGGLTRTIVGYFAVLMAVALLLFVTMYIK